MNEHKNSHFGQAGEELSSAQLPSAGFASGDPQIIVNNKNGTELLAG